MVVMLKAQRLFYFSFAILLFWGSPRILFAWEPKYTSIERIEVFGNKKSRDHEVVQASRLKVGDVLTPSLIVNARGKLLSTSIFEIVDIGIHRGSTDQTAVVRISVKEKITWFIVPNFSYSSGNFGGGLAYGESNLFGMFKKVLIAGNISTQNRTAVVAYRDPAVMGSQMILGIDGIYRWDTVNEYWAGDEVRSTRVVEYGASILPGIQWNAHFSSSFGVIYRRVRQEVRSQMGSARALTVPALRDGNEVVLTPQFRFDDSTTIEGVFRGYEISFEGQISDDRVFSDYDYYKQLLKFKAGLVWNKGLSYTNYSSAQFGGTLPYFRELTTGGDNLRGYRNREFRGDTRYSSNHELGFPIYRFKRLFTRGLLFWDSSVLYFRDEPTTREAWRNGIGVGVRAYLKDISIPVLGYDIGFGLEEASFQQYISVGVSF